MYMYVLAATEYDEILELRRWKSFMIHNSSLIVLEKLWLLIKKQILRMSFHYNP